MADVCINIGLRIVAFLVGVGLLFVMRRWYRRRGERAAKLRAEIAEARAGIAETREIGRTMGGGA